NINAGHEITSKARIIHQIQLIRGITVCLSPASRTPLMITPVAKQDISGVTNTEAIVPIIREVRLITMVFSTCPCQ
ncbi:hypothetical protein C9Z82_17290, partial [Escherichia coli]|uniref:hypothetical protein n=1 Tax=Escherichia coli TaxID=562 RepID=UPI00113DA707